MLGKPLCDPEQWCGFCLDRFSYALWRVLASLWVGLVSRCRVKRAHTGKPNYSGIRNIHSLGSEMAQIAAETETDQAPLPRLGGLGKPV